MPVCGSSAEGALEFCDRARSVIQAERHAETLFRNFRDSTLRKKKEEERMKAGGLQKETTRAQNAATIVGAIAGSVKTVGTTVAQFVAGTN